MTNIHTLNIVFSETNNGARLVFRTAESADKARGIIATARDSSHGLPSTKEVVITDDFGVTISFDPWAVVFYTVVDFAAELEANKAISLLQSKAQVSFQKQCENDPELRAFQQRMAFRQQLMNGGQAQG